MQRNSLSKRLAAFGVATMLLAAACTPGSTTSTAMSPIGTDSNLGTSEVSSPMPVTEATADMSGTIVSPTEAEMDLTPEGEATTMDLTPEGEATTMDLTPEGDATALAPTPEGPVVTAETTDMPAMTPENENMPAVLLSSELVGSVVVDNTGAEVGEVQELLVDDQGAVQYVIIDANTYLNDRVALTPEMTPVADATATMVEEGYVAVPLTSLTLNAQMEVEDESHVLLYDGTADDLHSMGAFDMTLFDTDGFLVDTTDSQVAANMTYDGLIRISQFGDFDLQNAQGDDLGEVEDLIVDVNQGLVTYGVVDFGGFLGLAEQTTAVPWTQFTIDRVSDTPGFRLDATSDTLEGAPTIDLGIWPNWFERIEGTGDWTMDWDSQIRTFWGGAASQ